MSQSQVDWDQEIPYNPEEEYQALLRALRRKRGFGLYFVQCSPTEGERIIQRVQADLPQKQMAVLKLEESLEKGNFYDRVEAFLQVKDKIEILFVEGLEYSLYDYEETKRRLGWSNEKIHTYSWEGVPHILSHLNQQRERFRDNFETCFVFLVPLFIIKYFIRRAPDFFDWRSDIFRFPLDQIVFQSCSSQALANRWDEYFEMTMPEKKKEVLNLQVLIEETEDPTKKAALLAKQGLLLNSLGQYDDALICCDKALELESQSADAWDSRGLALRHLGQYQESIFSCDKAIQIQPMHYWAWHDKGQTLAALRKYEEAITCYDKALSIKPDHYWTWDDRGNALADLGRYEEALINHETAIQFQPDYYWAWCNRGLTLSALGREKEAFDSYNKAIEFKPDFQVAWYNKACCYSLQGDVERAVEILAHAIELDSKYREMAKTDPDFDGIRSDDRFRTLVQLDD